MLLQLPLYWKLLVQVTVRNPFEFSTSTIPSPALAKSVPLSRSWRTNSNLEFGRGFGCHLRGGPHHPLGQALHVDAAVAWPVGLQDETKFPRWERNLKLWRARSRLYRSRFLQVNSNYSLESSRRDLHNTHLCTDLRSQNFNQNYLSFFANF